MCVITVEDGQSHTLSIGLETAVGGQRYFSNGDGNVYLVDKDIIENFQYGLYDVLKHQTLPEVAQLTGIKVELPDGGYEITRQENSGLAYSDDYVWFMDGKALDNDLTQTLLDMVTNHSPGRRQGGLYAGDQRLGGRRVLRAPERFQDDLPAGRRSQRYPALHHLRRFAA